ncbi:MAG: prepilin-type N-terminal cleavage/methylation domain-containing protein [Candidatus Omnitrophica bacterium]|nr:prepilin-type N-terminal cleavage/methylation domain-containing protein [Candidatus Omnitrophota bacterium]
MRKNKVVKKIRANKTIRSNRGITLIEIMVAMSIFVAMSAGVYTMMSTSQTSWLTTDAQIRLRDSLRKTNQRLSKELRQSGDDLNGVMQVSILNSGGPGMSDLLGFSMPILCEANGSVIDSNGDVANWGAPLTWGCTSSTCMDADNDCLTRDYGSLEYAMNGSNQLVRRVFDGSNGLVREDIFADNVTDFQASLSTDQNVVTVTTTAQTNADDGRTVTGSSSINIYLRNK